MRADPPWYRKSGSAFHHPQTNSKFEPFHETLKARLVGGARRLSLRDSGETFRENLGLGLLLPGLRLDLGAAGPRAGS